LEEGEGPWRRPEELGSGRGETGRKEGEEGNGVSRDSGEKGFEASNSQNDHQKTKQKRNRRATINSLWGETGEGSY